jgi:hypothetical protein
VDLHFLVIVVGALAAGLAAFLAYSRTEHGFFALRELRRRVRLLGVEGRRRRRGEHG